MQRRWCKVQFHHREPQVADIPRKHCDPTEWPRRTSSGRVTGPLVDVDSSDQVGRHFACQLHTHISIVDLQQLQASGDEILCSDLACLELPEHLAQEASKYPIMPVNTVRDFDKYNRLLTFTYLHGWIVAAIHEAQGTRTC